MSFAVRSLAVHAMPSQGSQLKGKFLFDGQPAGSYGLLQPFHGASETDLISIFFPCQCSISAAQNVAEKVLRQEDAGRQGHEGAWRS